MFILIIGNNILAEKVGFEPTEACTSSDFKSDAIDQLCHLSGRYQLYPKSILFVKTVFENLSYETLIPTQILTFKTKNKNLQFFFSSFQFLKITDF